MENRHYTVRSFGIVESSNGFSLADGFLVVEPSNTHEVVLQTNDYDAAWETANRLSKEGGHRGGDVNAAGVVIGRDDVALVARCESESKYGDGSFECPKKGARPGPFNLNGYHPCNL